MTNGALLDHAKRVTIESDELSFEGSPRWSGSAEVEYLVYTTLVGKDQIQAESNVVLKAIGQRVVEVNLFCEEFVT